MKNPFSKLIHHYTYDMRLKTKLVISHIILVLLPTAVPVSYTHLIKCFTVSRSPPSFL